jgi:hypothetical protein
MGNLVFAPFWYVVPRKIWHPRWHPFKAKNTLSQVLYFELTNGSSGAQIGPNIFRVTRLGEFTAIGTVVSHGQLKKQLAQILGPFFK